MNVISGTPMEKMLLERIEELKTELTKEKSKTHQLISLADDLQRKNEIITLLFKEQDKSLTVVKVKLNAIKEMLENQDPYHEIFDFT